MERCNTPHPGAGLTRLPLKGLTGIRVFNTWLPTRVVHMGPMGSTPTIAPLTVTIGA